MTTMPPLDLSYASSSEAKQGDAGSNFGGDFVVNREKNDFINPLIIGGCFVVFMLLLRK